MKYAFFGTPEFAAIILEKLIKAGMPPALVVCNPDRPVGRKKTITPPPTKVVAQNHSILIWQPESLKINPPAGGLKFKISGVDFAVVAAYAKILPKEVINAFPHGIIGAHPSLLPKYRGTTPIQSVILAGEKETGTTLFLIDEKVDHGPILAQRELNLIGPISPTYTELMQKLAELSADLLIETLPKFVKGEIKPRPQNESEATYTKKFSAEDGYVKPEDVESAKRGDSPDLAASIARKIRALNPEPGVWTIREGKRVKLLEAELKDSRLVIKKFQIEGKKPSVLKSPYSGIV